MTQLCELTTEDLKKDVEELTNIAIEDKIPIHDLSTLYDLAADPTYHEIDRWLKEKVLVSEITGWSSISKRFADRVIQRNHELLGQSQLGKITSYPIKVMLECVLFLYRDRIANLEHEARQNFFRRHRTASNTHKATDKS